MRVIVFGASGMVGQMVVPVCAADPDVSEVVAVVRSAGSVKLAGKVRELVHSNFFEWSDAELGGFDACLFCLGVSVVGKTEAEYRSVTYELTIAVAEALLKASPQAAFCYISGSGTDANGSAMWARVKGQTENALMAMPFRGVYCFRPGYIQPAKGMKSKVWWYNAVYSALGWGYPLLRKMAPGLAISSEEVGRAMEYVAKRGWAKQVLETTDIQEAAVAAGRVR